MPSAQQKIQQNMSGRKKSWLDRFDDYGIVHKERSPDGGMSYTRHGYIPMDGNAVNDGGRDYHLMAYMSGLKEIKQWDKSLPSHMLFTITEEKHKQRIQDGYRAE